MGTRGKFTPNQTIFCSLEILNPNKRIIIHLWLLYIKIHNLFHCYTSPTDMMFVSSYYNGYMQYDGVAECIDYV